MLISHRYKFIFLKTEKTASSSLQALFRKIISELDTLHPANPKIKQSLISEGHDLQNLSFDQGRGSLRRSLPRHFGLHGHAKAQDIRNFIGQEIFNSYTKITSERNPWDRQVSLFAHRSNKLKSFNLSDFDQCMRSPIYNLMHYNRLDNWGIYSIDEKLCADIVIRFEHLEADLELTLDQLGIDTEHFALPHKRGGYRKQSDNEYRKHYSEDSKQLVAKWYRKEIEHFGYEF